MSALQPRLNEPMTLHRWRGGHGTSSLHFLSPTRDKATAGASLARPRTSCLINNYNYAKFVSDAVQSALAQTVAFDEIIVVDDGSTDQSLELLRGSYGSHPRVQIIAKQNAGQLSSFNAGFLASSGDVIFFLDSDDVYEPNYLETMLRLYAERHQCDFFFCCPRLFGNEEREVYRYPEDTDFGSTVALTWFDRPWIGNATSCVSARRTLLARFLPLPNTHDWRLRADDCLVFGASLAGGRKFFLRQCLVRYRVHGKNGFFGQGLEGVLDQPRRMALDGLWGALGEKMGLTCESAARRIAMEYETIPDPTWKNFRQYVRMVQRAPLVRSARLQMLRKMIAHHRRSKRAFRTWRDRLALLTWRLRTSL